MFYRQGLGIERYARLQRSLKLTTRQVQDGTLPYLPLTHTGPRLVRYCRICLNKGFHSSLFQIPWVEFCPIHNQPLRNRCWICQQPLEAVWDHWFVANPYACRSCRKDLGTALGTALWPASQAERAHLRRLRVKYDLMYRSIKGYAFPRVDYPWSYWDLTHLSLNSDNGKYLTSNGVLLESVYEAKGRVPKTPQNAVEFVEPIYERHSESLEVRASLMPIVKAFRRHLEKNIPSQFRGDVRKEKRLSYIFDYPKQCRRNGFYVFLTWKLVWQFSTERPPVRKKYLIRIHDFNLIGTEYRVGGGSYDRRDEYQWLSPCIQKYELWMQEVMGGTAYPDPTQPPALRALRHSVSIWAHQHTFVVYLLSLRDEAQNLAKALIDYGFQWPYYSSPLEGRGSPLITITIHTPHATRELRAWQSVLAREQLERACYAFVWKTIQEQKRVFSAINGLRRDHTAH